MSNGPGIALRAAINLRRDSCETGRMPSALAPEPAALAMREAAVVECERLLALALPAERSKAEPEEIKVFQAMRLLSPIPVMASAKVLESITAYGDDRLH